MMFAAMNPDRKTTGGRAAVTLAVSRRMTTTIGLDSQQNTHRGRSIMGAASADLATAAFLAAPRVKDMSFNQVGLFAEATNVLSLRSRLIAGFRTDWHRATDDRMCVNASMCPGSSPLKNDTMGATNRKTLKSGFGRYEFDMGKGSTFYAGVGHAERSPDYWERLKQDPVTLNSAFLGTRPEKTTQFKGGLFPIGERRFVCSEKSLICRLPLPINVSVHFTFYYGLPAKDAIEQRLPIGKLLSFHLHHFPSQKLRCTKAKAH